MRHADGWSDTRRRLGEIVRARGPTEVADEIPLSRSQLFKLLRGDTESPSMPTQECIERFIDDQDLRTP